jgi:hypothetical protein
MWAPTTAVGVDTSAKVQVPGKTCHALSGGSCVSNAVAEAVYGWVFVVAPIGSTPGAST